jgi:hypothetical protein
VGEASFFTYHPVVEAHVRLYAVLHEEARTQGREFSATGAADAPDRAFFQTRVMRLTNPNDELGGMMFLATPQTVSHRIDRWSPMFPPAARFNTSHEAHDGDAYHFPGLVFREADREVHAPPTPCASHPARSHPPSPRARTAPCALRILASHDRTRALIPPAGRAAGAAQVATADERMPDYDGPQTYATSQSERFEGASDRSSTGYPSELFQPRGRRSSRDMSRDSSVGSGLFNRGFRQRKGSRDDSATDAAARTAAAQVSVLPTLPPIASSPSNTPEITPRASKTDKPAEGGASAHAPCESERSLNEASCASSLNYENSRRGESYRGTSSDGSVCPATGNRANTQQLLEMRKLIKQHLSRSHLEVVVIVEAIDPHSSNTFQARHSYARRRARASHVHAVRPLAHSCAPRSSLRPPGAPSRAQVHGRGHPFRPLV